MTELLRPVTVLYTMPRSVYLGLPGVDCWDEARDARKWPGGTPVVAHPPCRLWCRLRGCAKAHPDEKNLGRHAAKIVRRWEGILEQPAHSLLFADQGLPKAGQRDEYGFTQYVSGKWFGHPAEKPTWLYIVGVTAADCPPIPYTLAKPQGICGGHKRFRIVREIRKRERSMTTLALAEWLVAVARLVQPVEAPCST